MRGRGSFLFAEKAEPLLLVFLFVLLPLAGTRLAGDGDNAGGQGLCPTGRGRALGAGGHLVLIGGNGGGDGLDPGVHFVLDKGRGTSETQRREAGTKCSHFCCTTGLGTVLTRG